MSKISNIIIFSVGTFLYSEIPDLENIKVKNFLEEIDSEKIILKSDYNTNFDRGLPESFDRQILDKACQKHAKIQIDWNNKDMRSFEYFGPSYICIFKNHLITPKGTIFNSNQQIIFNQSEKHPRKAGGDFFNKINELDLRRDYIEHDELLALNHPYAGAYYHFVAETLARLTLFLNNFDIIKKIKILLPNKTKYINEYLDILGINKDQVITSNPQKNYKANKVYFPRPISWGSPSREDLIRIKTIFLNILELKPIKEKIIIIKRLKGPRQILNHDNLLNEIKRNFPQEKIVEFDDRICIKDTIKLFSEAKLIIGPHGAGLSNMIFSPKGVPIIEIQPSKFTLNLCFWHMAKALEMKHWFVLNNECTNSDNFECSLEECIRSIKMYI